MHLLSVLATALAIRGAASLTPAEWRKQSIYQVMTDRFARSDGSTTAACDTSQQIYCGGSWQGLIDRLSYIQGMGFTAIWISPVVGQMSGDTEDGCVVSPSRVSESVKGLALGRVANNSDGFSESYHG